MTTLLKPPDPIEFVYPTEALKGGLRIVAVVRGMKRQPAPTYGMRTGEEVAAFQHGISWPLLEKTPSIRVVFTSSESVIEWSGLSVVIEKIIVEVLITEGIRFKEEFATPGEAKAFIKGLNLLCELHDIPFFNAEAEIVRAA